MVLSGGKIRKNGRQLLLWNGNLRRAAPSGDRVTGETGKQGRCVVVGRLRGGSEMRFRCAGSLPSGEGERAGVRRSAFCRRRRDRMGAAALRGEMGRSHPDAERATVRGRMDVRGGGRTSSGRCGPSARAVGRKERLPSALSRTIRESRGRGCVRSRGCSP